MNMELDPENKVKMALIGWQCVSGVVELTALFVTCSQERKGGSR